MKVAAATVEITPERVVTLGGNGLKEEIFDSIDSSIEINGLRLVGDSSEIFVISVDSLFFPVSLLESALQLLRPALELKVEQFLLCASHTHYAPHLDEDKPQLGTVDIRYREFVVKQLVKLIAGLCGQRLVETCLSYCRLDIQGLSVQRRQKVWRLLWRVFPWRIIRMVPNLEAKIDTAAHLLYFREINSGKQIAALWSWACHPVLYHSAKSLTAHFPADVRNYLRQREDLPVLYLQGFSGDIRPRQIAAARSLGEKLCRLVNGSLGFIDFTQETYTEWVAELFGQLNHSPETEDTLLAITPFVRRQELKLSEIWNGGSPVDEVILQALFLDQNTVLLTVSAEVVSGYSLKLKELFPQLRIIPVGCTGSVFGYWPTRAMLVEKGYEVDGFKANFSLHGQFRKNLEDTFLETVGRLLRVD